MEETNKTEIETTLPTETTPNQEPPKMVKISKGIFLPYNTNDTNPFVPEDNIDFKNINRILEQTSIAINANIPILLAGEQGTGKNALIKALAAKTNNGYRRASHNGGTSTDDILGKILINKSGTYWVDGVLIDAMRTGSWYCADEINSASPEVLFIYHSLLDDDGYIVLAENGGEIIKPHPSFRFFATMNPSSDYSGVRELNKALMSRFLVLRTDFPSPNVEANILNERCGIDKNIAEKLVAFAVEVRATHAKEKIQYVLSTRDLLMWGKMLGIYGKYMISAEMSILNKVGRDDRDMIKDLLALHFKCLDELKPGETPPTTETIEISHEEGTEMTTAELERNIELINNSLNLKKTVNIPPIIAQHIIEKAPKLCSTKTKKLLKEIVKKESEKQLEATSMPL